MVEAKRLAIPHDLMAIDKHIAHRPFGSAMQQAAQRIVDRLHLGMPQINQHKVGLCADGEPPDVIAAKCPG